MWLGCFNLVCLFLLKHDPENAEKCHGYRHWCDRIVWICIWRVSLCNVQASLHLEGKSLQCQSQSSTGQNCRISATSSWALMNIQRHCTMYHVNRYVSYLPEMKDVVANICFRDELSRDRRFADANFNSFEVNFNEEQEWTMPLSQRPVQIGEESSHLRSFALLWVIMLFATSA